MGNISYQTNKNTGQVYAYDLEYYRDPTTGRRKSRRRYLGRVDPQTKEILPKGSGGRRNREKLPSEVGEEDQQELSKDVRELRAQVLELKGEVSRLTREKQKADQLVQQLRVLIETYKS